jgi:hypothetical protein
LFIFSWEIENLMENAVAKLALIIVIIFFLPKTGAEEA